MTGLEASFRVRRGDFALSLDLAVPTGAVAAVVGRNGSGKTTSIRALAGLVRPSEGSIVLDGRILDDPHTHVAARTRRAGVVFQDYLLFPHLSALENVAFGLTAKGVHRDEARGLARGWLDRFDLGRHASARPGELSGGQAQRVALARALVLEPPLLLLDEPLAALDSSIRASLRLELGRVLGTYGGATVLVTHDAADALALASQIVVLEAGVVVQRGTPTEVASAPASEYVADLFGAGTDRVT